ncbi:SDR family NAD(P)-dependent oxidoreductase [Halobacillus litoralis]|uniref:SDR family NAD(P)-dependent oxidoreductase n=1 Tax=Halobacillus litoralis TaxID=45668 RepID=UPI001CD5EC6D|nr:SDR family NAD(P)-dependent oxidoreductase [Halobacillus litoralis]MCA0969198.1 SDR family NAD(P)-dependent oxidoreductase [Halobacillus litoralis]
MSYTVITGASAGIGYQTAHAFAERGKNLLLTARRENVLLSLKKELEETHSIEVHVFPADLSETEQVYDFYQKLEDFELETFINNAGFGHYNPITNQELPRVEKMLRVNNEALTILSTLFAKDYASVEGTQLINVSSNLGYNVIEGSVTYAATKFYVSAFTEGLAQELTSSGSSMKVKILAPAATETEFAKHAADVDQFNYEENFKQYHTSVEMAQFMMALYDSDLTVGIVDGSSYEFQLRGPIFPYISK